VKAGKMSEEDAKKKLTALLVELFGDENK